MQILRLGRAEGEGDSRCGVLVLWDNRVLRVVGYGSWGSQSLAILRTVKMGLSGFSWGCMVPLVGVIERVSRWN